MVKLTLYTFIAVLLSVVLALASDNRDIETRAVSEDSHLKFGRELTETETILFSRDIQELFARLPAEDETHELVSRRIHIHISEKVKAGWHKFVNGLKNVGNLIVREDEQEFVARNDGLDAREPFHLEARDHELIARALQDGSELYERDLEDLYQREFFSWETDELD
ncbi:hypothetical protein BYT27DRAFT_7191210 [Phlegmacium glaucopus]|nr:hypothetical protein BYT27DRAFT_7191210 [Phlegmacium glaucopus]